MTNLPTAVSGTRLFISAILPSANTKAAFDAVPFTQVRGVRFLGDIPIQHETRERKVIDFPAVKTVRTGAKIYPVLPIEVYRIADAGQAIFDLTVEAAQAYSYKILRADGSGVCFTAITLKKTIALGDSENVHIKPFELSFDSIPIEF